MLNFMFLYIYHYYFSVVKGQHIEQPFLLSFFLEVKIFLTNSEMFKLYSMFSKEFIVPSILGRWIS